jgi:hypothetical protein
MTKPTHYLNSQGILEEIKWPKGKVVFESGAVFLVRARKDVFHVVYGLEVHKGFDYFDAAKILGYCLIHQLHCEGVL